VTPEAPTWFAWLALGCWPLVVLAAYAVRRSSHRLARTTAWMMILPVMFLPAALAFKQPLVPALDKHRLAFLSIALALQIFHRRELLRRAPWHSFPRLVLLGLLLGVVQTVRTNGEGLAFADTTLPGLDSHDALSIAISMVLDLYLPFAVGQRVFRTERDLRDLLEVLGICALIYAPFCLVELRFSPQFHRWVYGYHQHSFLQAVRGQGYRPVVFMKHGLSVATFMFSCLCAALALYTVRARVRPSAGTRSIAAGALVLLCKSLAVIFYSLAAVPLFLFRSSKAMSRAVLLLTMLVIAYPAVRAAKVMPAKQLVTFFHGISPARAGSLVFRLVNEEELLARAVQRPLFGWGTWGRNRIYASWGQDVSVTDGQWIIVLGMFGVVGLVGFFALMLVPVVRFVRHRADMPPTSQILVGSLALIVVIFAVDLLPNATGDFLSMAYAGALFTLSERLRRPLAPRAPRTWAARSPMPAPAPTAPPAARSAPPSPSTSP
jgi:hypothetical protein